jgi:general L-amino acid transport system substrate-binding protein
MRRCLLGLLLLLGFAGTVPAQTLEAVRQRGDLRCGVFGRLPGFSAPDQQGVMRGIDADFCRAVAAAVLGSAEKVTFVTSPTPDAGLLSVETGEVDVLARNLTITAMRDAGRNLSPTGVLFYDGQGILVRRDLGIATFAQLDGKRICVAGGGVNASLATLRDAARRAGITVIPVESPLGGPVLFEGFRAGRCDAITADAAGIAALAVTQLPDPSVVVVLPERLSREPLTAWVRGDDSRWRQLVTWTLHALVAAEELDIASTSLDEALRSDSNEVRLLLGLDRGLGAALNLADTWALEVIRQVGNYSEIFERNLGAGSALGQDRGLSDLWRRGGLLYPYPFR